MRTCTCRIAVGWFTFEAFKMIPCVLGHILLDLFALSKNLGYTERFVGNSLSTSGTFGLLSLCMLDTIGRNGAVSFGIGALFSHNVKCKENKFFRLKLIVSIGETCVLGSRPGWNVQSRYSSCCRMRDPIHAICTIKNYFLDDYQLLFTQSYITPP